MNRYDIWDAIVEHRIATEEELELEDFKNEIS